MLIKKWDILQFLVPWEHILRQQEHRRCSWIADTRSFSIIYFRWPIHNLHWNDSRWWAGHNILVYAFQKSSVSKNGIFLNVFLACPPCPTVPDSLLTIAAEAQHFDSEANVPNGFSIAQVVAIALASFVIGLLFMAGIWFVHRQTGAYS